MSDKKEWIRLSSAFAAELSELSASLPEAEGESDYDIGYNCAVTCTKRSLDSRIELVRELCGEGAPVPRELAEKMVSTISSVLLTLITDRGKDDSEFARGLATGVWDCIAIVDAYLKN